MTPGIYDIDNETYHASEGLSRSNIMDFKKSPFHFYWSKQTPRNKETSSQYIGTALHTLILEPEKFHSTYMIAPKINKNTNEWKKIKADAEEKNLLILDGSEYHYIVSLARTVEHDPTAIRLIEGAQYERSIFWENPETGILCKCRPDILHTNMICDLKTAADASERAFRNAIYSYGYHIQAAMMQEGVQAVLGDKINDFIFIVIEKNEPMAMAIYILDEDAINKGREDFHEALHQYKECLEKNEWPGYPIKEVSLPKYAYAV
jgi:exodeoxyribonuclease VIII